MVIREIFLSRWSHLAGPLCSAPIEWERLRKHTSISQCPSYWPSLFRAPVARSGTGLQVAVWPPQPPGAKQTEQKHLFPLSSPSWKKGRLTPPQVLCLRPVFCSCFLKLGPRHALSVETSSKLRGRRTVNSTAGRAHMLTLIFPTEPQRRAEWRHSEQPGVLGSPRREEASLLSLVHLADGMKRILRCSLQDHSAPARKNAQGQITHVREHNKKGCNNKKKKTCHGRKTEV